MSWNPITTANIRMQPVEQAVLNNISGSSTVLAEILGTVVGEFVEAIQQGGNQFAQDGTVPDVVRPHVIARTRWLWLCEFPEMKKFQTKERSDLNEAAVKFRDQIATGAPKIAPPNNPAPAGAVPIVTMPYVGEPKLREFRKWKEDGI
jgi:hypothetical protein